MFEEISSQVMNVLTLSVGGVSILSVVAGLIYVVKAIAGNRKEIKITKEEVESAFKEAVLPSNIKLDVSNKIAKPIKEGLNDITLALDERLAKVERGEQLLLAILSQFNHMSKLPEDLQKEIKEYCDVETIEEVKL